MSVEILVPKDWLLIPFPLYYLPLITLTRLELLYLVLGKMLRSEGITNMLITEVPMGSNNIGSGMEEFVADGITTASAW